MLEDVSLKLKMVLVLVRCINMVLSISKLAMAVLVAVIVGIVLVALLGPLLLTFNVPIAETVGKFFVNYGYILGLASGIWYYFSGSTSA